jgi:hypothetical protein
MPKLMGAHRPIPWICVDDLGAIATRAFADPDRFIGAGLKLAADICSIADCREIWTEIIGRAPRRFPMPVWLFKRFAGTDLITMWRWLRTGKVDLDPSETHEILPAALTVRKWSCSAEDMRSNRRADHVQRSRLPIDFPPFDARSYVTPPVFKRFE